MISETTIIEVQSWLLGGLFTIVLALIGVLYSTLVKEVKDLREWRHNIVTPALTKLAVLTNRVKTLEEIEDGQ